MGVAGVGGAMNIEVGVLIASHLLSPFTRALLEAVVMATSHQLNWEDEVKLGPTKFDRNWADVLDLKGDGERCPVCDECKPRVNIPIWGKDYICSRKCLCNVWVDFAQQEKEKGMKIYRCDMFLTVKIELIVNVPPMMWQPSGTGLFLLH